MSGKPSAKDVIRKNLFAIFCCLFNVASVIAIVIVNKSVFKTLNFHFPITLVCIHVCVTFIGLRLAAALGIFERKQFDVRPLVIMAVSFCLYNASSLANLNINTVSFYQISKILVTPTVMVAQFMLFRKSTTVYTKISVLIMCIGVGLSTVSEVDVTTLGFVIGGLAIIGATQQQIIIKKWQTDLGCSSNQLLVAYTPYAAVVLAMMSPLDNWLPDNVDNDETVFTWFQTNATYSSVFLILFSACLGLLVSLSTFLVIKATGPLTYNIVGHLKTVGILTIGVAAFKESMSAKKFLGIVIALVGIVMYSCIKLRQQQAEGSHEKTNVSSTFKDNDVSSRGSRSRSNSNSSSSSSDSVV